MNAQRKIAYVVRIDQEIQKKKIKRLYKKGHQRLLNWIHKFRPTFKYIDMQTLQTHTIIYIIINKYKRPLTVNSLFAICADC